MILRRVLPGLVAAALGVAVVGAGQHAVATTDPTTLRLAFTQRATFEQPVAVTSARDGSGRLFVVEKTGRVQLFVNGAKGAKPYLDLSPSVDASGERGLLGLVFSPTFAQDRYFWAAFTTTDGRLRVRRYTAPSAGATSVPATAGVTVIDVPHPGQANHNGGQLAFGADGLLYIGTGDGGGGGDPNANALNLRSLSGKVLRLDARHSCGGRAYCIPSSNPFVHSSSARHEIWGYGLRNPWKFSFDRATGVLWLADVGQEREEEIDKVAKGYVRAPNFGWSCMEGKVVYDSSRCSGATATTNRVVPSFVYGHYDNHKCGGAVIGGYVYRGSTYASFLRGVYVYGDYCFDYVFAWNGVKAAKVGVLAGIAGFGESDTGELWAVSVSSGGLYQVSATQV